MADGMYVSMSGAAARAEQLESVADNLANAQTVGFTAARPVFQAVLVEGSEGQLTYTETRTATVDLRPGSTVATGRTTDIVPENGAFLAVSTPTGEPAYTRDGRLSVGPDGTLRAGPNPVLAPGNRPIFVPAQQSFTIDARGFIRSEGQEIGQLALFQLDGPQVRRGGAMLAPSEGGRAVPVEGTIRTGELVQANTSPLEAAVQLVNVQRNYDTSMQALTTYRRLDERANELGRSR